MWKKEYSAALTKICVIIFMAAFVVCVAAGPWIIDSFVRFYRTDLLALKPWFALSAYSCAFPAGFALYHLYRLLIEIEHKNVFTLQNIRHLRILSWCCTAAAVICLASAFYYLPFLFVAIAAAFMALILRVIKNVFVEAHEIKSENDFTI